MLLLLLSCCKRLSHLVFSGYGKTGSDRWIYGESQHSHVILPARAICCSFPRNISLMRSSISALFLQPNKRAGGSWAGREPVNPQPQHLWVNRGNKGEFHVANRWAGTQPEGQAWWDTVLLDPDPPQPDSLRTSPTWSPQTRCVSAWIQGWITKD